MSTNNTQNRDIDLALLIDRFMRKIHFGLQSRSPSFDKESVGPGGGIVLMTLAEMGRVSLNELTKQVSRDKSQMTRTIQSLERKGLIQRENSATDKRVSLVSLTPQGEIVVTELMGAVAKVIDGILQPITSAEKETLKKLLARTLAS